MPVHSESTGLGDAATERDTVGELDAIDPAVGEQNEQGTHRGTRPHRPRVLVEPSARAYAVKHHRSLSVKHAKLRSGRRTAAAAPRAPARRRRAAARQLRVRGLDLAPLERATPLRAPTRQALTQQRPTSAHTRPTRCQTREAGSCQIRPTATRAHRDRSAAREKALQRNTHAQIRGGRAPPTTIDAN